MSARPIISILVILSACLVLSGAASAAGPVSVDVAGHIAFLRDGDVWIIGTDGQGVRQVTSSDGTVEEFLFSPDLKHLACSMIIGYADEPGWLEEGEEAGKRAVCSIVIVRLLDMGIVTELMPPEDNWIYPARWLPGERLMYYAASGYDVWGFFEYDIREGARKDTAYEQARKSIDADYTADGTLTAYTDNVRVEDKYMDNLTIRDSASGDDRIVATRKSILDPGISCDKTHVAFIEVEYVEKEGFDNLWVCDLESDSLQRLYRGPAKAKDGNVRAVSWSFDGRYIGMFFSPEALVLETGDPSNIHKISGIDFNWIGNDRFVFAQGDTMFTYEMSTGTKEILLENASKPAFLQKIN